MDAMADAAPAFDYAPFTNQNYEIKRRRTYRAYDALQSNPFTKRGTPFSKSFFGESYGDANDFQRAMRRGLRFKGKGSYFEPNAQIGSLFRRGGEWLGNRFGHASAGRSLGAAASKFLGFGAYDTPMSGNDLVTSLPGGGSQQQIGTVGDESGDLIVRNTEFIGNITATYAGVGAGASPFTVVTYQLNPGLQATFPFLSQIAQCYELYDWIQLLFQYKPLSGEMNASSNSLGSVIMCTNYDPDGNVFLNKIQMENYSYANSTKPSCGAVHGVECKSGSGVTDMKYTRAGMSSRDKIFTDIGSFQVATEGVPFASAGTMVLGELWVTYTVKLSRPNLFNSLLGQGIMQDMFTATCLSASSSISNVVASGQNLIGGLLAPNAAGTAWLYQFPKSIVAGTYHVSFVFESTAVGGANNVIVCGGSSATILTNQSTPDGAPQPGTNDKISVMVIVKVTGPGQDLSFYLNAPATTTYNVKCIVMQVNSNAVY